MASNRKVKRNGGEKVGLLFAKYMKRNIEKETKEKLLEGKILLKFKHKQTISF